MGLVGVYGLTRDPFFNVSAGGNEVFERIGYVASLQTKTEVVRRRQGHLWWGALKKNTPLGLGDVIFTGPTGRISIELKTGTKLHLQEDTLIQLSLPRQNEIRSDFFELDLKSGGVEVEQAKQLPVQRPSVPLLSRSPKAPKPLRLRIVGDKSLEVAPGGKAQLKKVAGEVKVQSSSQVAQVTPSEAPAPVAVNELTDKLDLEADELPPMEYVRRSPSVNGSDVDPDRPEVLLPGSDAPESLEVGENTIGPLKVAWKTKGDVYGSSFVEFSDTPAFADVRAEIDTSEAVPDGANGFELLISPKYLVYLPVFRNALENGGLLYWRLRMGGTVSSVRSIKFPGLKPEQFRLALTTSPREKGIVRLSVSGAVPSQIAISLGRPVKSKFVELCRTQMDYSPNGSLKEEKVSIVHTSNLVLQSSTQLTLIALKGCTAPLKPLPRGTELIISVQAYNAAGVALTPNPKSAPSLKFLWDP